MLSEANWSCSLGHEEGELQKQSRLLYDYSSYTGGIPHATVSRRARAEYIY